MSGSNAKLQTSKIVFGVGVQGVKQVEAKPCKTFKTTIIP